MSRLRLVAALLVICGMLLFPVIGSASPPAEGARPGDPMKVFVVFDRQPGPSEEAIVHAAGGKIRYTYSLVPAIAASIPQAAIQGLQRNPRVSLIEPVIEVHAIDAEIDAELDNTWGVKHIGAGTVHTGGNVGAGVKVAIVDSGVDCTHLDLVVRCEDGYDFVNDDRDPMDDDGHGTHVAGTVAANRDGSGVVGVAPGAKVYALKVLGADGRGNYADVIAAIQWAVINGIQVTNNSYGSSGDPGYLVKKAFDNAYASGVLHVASAGNSGKLSGTGDNVGYPARYDSVIAVAATDSSNRRASFSSTGPAVEMAAPGVSIRSTVMGSGYAAWNGTSMASPHVAGTAALIIASGIADTNDNGKINDEVRLRLRQTALDLGSAGRDPHFGFGLVNAAAAAGGGSPPPADTMHVEALRGIPKSLSRNTWQATVTITVHKSDEASVESATLTGNWSGGYTGTSSCITGGNGQCSVTSGGRNVKKASVTFMVTGVTHGTLTYASGDVTSIVVSKP